MPSRRAAITALTVLTVVVAVVAALTLPFTAQAAWPEKMAGAEFTQFVARQVADWGPAIKAADIKP